MSRLLALLVIVVSCARAADARVPWTGSRIVGTPEPPKPFVSEAVQPHLQFVQGIELARVPGSDRLLLVERRGGIHSFAPGAEKAVLEEVLNLPALHPRLEHIYSVALHPRFRETRELYACFVMPEGQKDGSRVSRFKLASLDPLRADPGSEEVLFTWPSGGHNGCSLQFGPDGCLYVSTGDAGPAAPPDLYDTGQDVSDLTGGILRLDIARRDPGLPYAIPPDNPWVGRPGVRPELWAYGLRNPWRMSFDSVTGNLWCGDIGWELWEMVHLIRRGGNYGWSAYEASQPIKPERLNPLAPVTPPVVAHPHSEAASITGGLVYHGKKYPELTGAFLYGDYATGKVWALWHDGDRVTRHEEIADTPHAIIAFAPDRDGEPYYLHYASPGTLHRLVRNPRAAVAAEFPRRLSATVLFADVARQVPAPGVESFAIGTPMWQDGATARRYLALPGTASLSTTANRRFNRRTNTTQVNYATRWPAGAVLARTLMLGQLAPTAAERDQPVETQVLHYDGEAWAAYSYRWNDAGTDAELVPAEGAERPLRVAADPRRPEAGTREYAWRFSSRAECLRCHNSWHNGALAFTVFQLRGAGEEQVRRLVAAGCVDENFAEQVRAQPEASDLAGQARALLHANCMHCHSQNAGGAVAIQLNVTLPLAQLGVVDTTPLQGGLGLKAPKIVDAGRPWNSVLAVRMAKTGAGHMPPVGPHEPDVEGLKLVEDWIASLAEPGATGPAWQVPGDDEALARELASVEGAMRVRRAIDNGRLDGVRRDAACRLAWQSPEPTVRDLFDRFKPDELRERTLGANIDATALLALRGDPARGARLVSAEGKLASCLACHLIRGQGRQVGPELSRLGAQQTAAQILDSVLHPSKTVAPLYRTAVVKLRDGSTQTGFVRARGVRELVLSSAGGESVKIALGEIATEETSLTSLMPEGLLQGVTAQEAADLVAYLASLR